MFFSKHKCCLLTEIQMVLEHCNQIYNLHHYLITTTTSPRGHKHCLIHGHLRKHCLIASKCAYTKTCIFTQGMNCNNLCYSPDSPIMSLCLMHSEIGSLGYRVHINFIMNGIQDVLNWYCCMRDWYTDSMEGNPTSTTQCLLWQMTGHSVEHDLT